MTTSTFADILTSEVATLQAQFPDFADALGRAGALVADGAVFVEESGRDAMVRSSGGDAWYHVNGSCLCKASQHRSEPCKHRLAFRLYQRLGDRLMVEEERWTIDLDEEDSETAAPTIPAHALTMIQGRPFIKFEGLLTFAHECGLVELITTVVRVSATLAVCQSTARFKDGRTFTDIGDASPDNVARHLAPHFIRMAATRASARVLRRALNITVCAVEELSDEAGA